MWFTVHQGAVFYGSLPSTMCHDTNINKSLNFTEVFCTAHHCDQRGEIYECMVLSMHGTFNAWYFQCMVLSMHGTFLCSSVCTVHVHVLQRSRSTHYCIENQQQLTCIIYCQPLRGGEGKRLRIVTLSNSINLTSSPCV